MNRLASERHGHIRTRTSRTSIFLVIVWPNSSTVPLFNLAIQLLTGPNNSAVEKLSTIDFFGAVERSFLHDEIGCVWERLTGRRQWSLPQKRYQFWGANSHVTLSASPFPEKYSWWDGIQWETVATEMPMPVAWGFLNGRIRIEEFRHGKLNDFSLDKIRSLFIPSCDPVRGWLTTGIIENMNKYVQRSALATHMNNVSQ